MHISPRPYRTLATAAAIVILAACSATPPAPPAPAKPVTKVSTADSARLARAHVDSIKNAELQRERLAQRAHLNSLVRVNTVSRAAETAARVALGAAVHFERGSAEVLPADKPLLEKKAALLAANPQLHIKVLGFAYEQASEQSDVALGMKRAAAVRQYFETHGADSTRVAVESFGMFRPLCRSTDESCKSLNRRDEFTILSGGSEINLAP